MHEHPSTTPAAPPLSGRPVEFNSVRGHIPSLTQTTIGRALVAKCGELRIRKRFQTTIRKHLLAREQWALASIQAMTSAEAIEMSIWPCERCGRGFTLARLTRRFCSEECERAASSERHRVKQQEKQCRLALYEGPSHTFTPVRSNQKYCCPEHIRRGAYLSKLAENRAAARQRYEANAPAILLRQKKKRKDDPKWAKKKNKQSKAWRKRNPERAAELDKRKTDKRALVSKVLAAADRAGVKPETLLKRAGIQKDGLEPFEHALGNRGGRPKGMMDETLEEARQLERLMSAFETRHGTRKGALQDACKKVYPRSLDPLKAVRRASKTLTKYRRNMRTKPI